MIDRHKFYTIFKAKFGKFTQSQVDGFNAIFDEWENQKLSDVRQLAYILATVWHETARTMQPIEEIGKGKGKPYGKKLDFGNVPYTAPDKLYYGRGHTQNTWRTIYLKLTTAAKKQGKNWDFLNNPELLLQMQPSIWATFFGMITGLYTGRKLSQYFNATVCDPKNARRIINGLDCADKISIHYGDFLNCLR